jgi:hypothetical protein
MLICFIVALINSTPWLLIVDYFIDPLSDISTLFKCGLCLGFWIGLIFHLITLPLTLHIIGWAAITAILTELLDKIIKRF